MSRLTVYHLLIYRHSQATALSLSFLQFPRNTHGDEMGELLAPLCDQRSEESEMAGEKISWADSLTPPIVPSRTLPLLGSVKTMMPQDGISLGFSSPPRGKPPMGQEQPS